VVRAGWGDVELGGEKLFLFYLDLTLIEKTSLALDLIHIVAQVKILRARDRIEILMEIMGTGFQSYSL
jgi:hypothetical protein